MSGPGSYGPDATEGVARVEDLPSPRIVERSRNYRSRPCPKCGRKASRLRTVRRTLHDLGDAISGRPRDLHVTYSQHRCRCCNYYFNADTLLDLALPNAHYTHRVVALAVRIVVEDGLPYRSASWHLWRDHRVFVPFATIQNWVEAAGEKSRASGQRRAGTPGRRLGRLRRLHRRR